MSNPTDKPSEQLFVHSVESTGTPLRSDSACGAPSATAEG